MKLIRTNKYSKCIATGLSTILLSSLILSGCSTETNEKEIVSIVEEVSVTQTPFVTVAPTIESTPTPSVEPTATPEVTPFVRTSYEVPSKDYVMPEIEELGIIDDDTSYKAYNFQCLYFVKNGQKKVMCVKIPGVTDKKNDYVVKNAFTDEELFRFDLSDCKDGYSDSMEARMFYEFESITTISSYFEDVNIKSIEIRKLWLDWLFDYTKPYMDKKKFNKVLDDVYGKGVNVYFNDKYSYTRNELANYYIKYLPEEYRVDMYDLHPELEEEHVKKLS